MTTPKPTIVLVPGAWHTPAAYDPILPFLHAAGYPTTSVHHPSVGVSPGLPDFSADVAAVRATVGGLSDLGRDIVLVSHSYGAIPASEAVRGLGKSERKANGLPGGVIKLFYIAAIVPKKGGSLVDCLTESADPSMEDGRPALGRVDNGVRKKISPITDLKYGIPHADTISQDGTDSITNGPEIFYHDVSPAEQKYHVSLLRTQSLGLVEIPFLFSIFVCWYLMRACIL